MSKYTYSLENAYLDNTKISLFYCNRKVDEQIVHDHELDGYCRCLEDFGWELVTSEDK